MDEKNINIDKLIITDRKTISLEINNKGNLIVRAPKYASKDRILNFVFSKFDWIKDKQGKAIEKNNEKNQFYENKILFYGREIEIIYQKGIDKVLVLNNNKLIINEDYINQSKEIIKYWLKKNAKTYLNYRTEQLATKYNFTFNKLRISNAIHKWGSCNSKKNIALNWRLIMADKNLSDYVIIHELAHTLELNHSKKFWSIVENIIPNYKKIKYELRNISHLLDY